MDPDIPDTPEMAYLAKILTWDPDLAENGYFGYFGSLPPLVVSGVGILLGVMDIRDPGIPK